MSSKYYGAIRKKLQVEKVKTLEERRVDGEVIDYISRSVRLAADGGKAEVVVNPTNVVIASSENTAIGLGNDCIILDGNVAFSKNPDNIAINGFWRLNEELLTTLPSTLFNPVQTLVFKYPSSVKKASKLIKLLSAQ